MRMREHAIFFLRHIADIDHISPVIYFWSQVRGRRATVILYGNWSITADFRVSFLRGLPGIEMLHVAEVAPAILGRSLRPEECDWLAQSDGPAAHREWVEKLFEKIAPSANGGVVVFDWIFDKFQRVVRTTSRQYGMKMVALPHGLSTFAHTNRMHGIDSLNPFHEDVFCHPPEATELYEYLVYPSADFLSLCRPEFVPARAKVLGAARYDLRWQEILKSFLPRLDTQLPPGMKKVVLFPRSKFYPIFWDELQRTIKMLLHFENLCILLPHHPRENDFIQDLTAAYAMLNEVERSRFRVVSPDEVPSAAIVEWADLVLDLGTGMGFEAVVRNKPVVEIEYVSALVSTLSKELPGTRVDCRDELCAQVKRVCAGDHTPNYTPSDRERFLSKFIGDYRGGTVLDAYDDLLVSCARGVGEAR